MLRSITLIVALVVVAGCQTTTSSTKGPVLQTPIEVQQSEIADLTAGLLALGPDIDPEEAARAARISVQYPLKLKQEWNVTDRALLHNTKVNMGLRPMGLCYQWADALEARLRQENFKTLYLHRAIANSNNIRLEHSTVIASALGQDLSQGMVLDPWRLSGTLFWSKTLEDTRYKWVARRIVMEQKAKRRESRGST
ncbi:MAG: hypothetical protein GY717_12270 [Rhodobacteraceae bacterium]|nr:hypothetical protein [Paracoccaceae bacterium]